MESLKDQSQRGPKSSLEKLTKSETIELRNRHIGYYLIDNSIKIRSKFD